jgi:hypothetical protein
MRKPNGPAPCHAIPLALFATVVRGLGASALGRSGTACFGALLPREDAVEAAWAVVDPVLDTHHQTRACKPGGWGRNRLMHSSPQAEIGTTRYWGRRQNDRSERGGFLLGVDNIRIA